MFKHSSSSPGRTTGAAFVVGLLLACLSPATSAQCPWGSIQSRVQPNVSTPWTTSLTVGAGQSFRVGGFYNGTGYLDTSGNTHLEIIGPGTYRSYPANGSYVALSGPGTYTLRAYCGSLNDYASITVTSGCPYQSIQVRVQPNTSTPWTTTLTVQAGQSFRVGGFYDSTGLLAPSGIALRVTGPGGFNQSPANGAYVTTTQTGSYQVTGTCGTLTDSATVTASTVAATTNPKRFVTGIGVAWGSQWSQIASDPTLRAAWDRANLDQVVAAGGTATHVSFDWSSIETSEGIYDWTYADQQVAEAEKRGLEMFAYTGNTPEWALPSLAILPRCPGECGRGHRQPPTLDPKLDPKGIGIERLQRFHRKLAGHYCGRVKYYEFWNEPNGCSWRTCGCGDQTDEQKLEYARWLGYWYTAMKEGCPDAVLSVGGLDCNWGNDPRSAAPWCVDWLGKLYANGAGNSFDAVTLHPYGYQGTPAGADPTPPQTTPPPEMSLDQYHKPTIKADRVLNFPVIDGVTSLLASQGQSHKQLWLDEWGFVTKNDTLKRGLVQTTLNTLQSQYPNVFEARYLTVTDVPAGTCAGTTGVIPWGLTDISISPPGLVPRSSWQGFRDIALGADTSRLTLWNPGLEYRGEPASSEYGRMPNWGPQGAWAYHKNYPRTGHDVLGRKFGFYSAGTTETVGQVLDATFQPGRTYRFKASVHGGGDNTGTLPMEIGYQDTSGAFQPLTTPGARVLVPLGPAWVDTPGAYYTAPASGLPIGRPIWVRFGTGGSTDAWFDNILVTATPVQ